MHDWLSDTALDAVVEQNRNGQGNEEGTEGRGLKEGEKDDKEG